jgi:integrase
VFARPDGSPVSPKKLTRDWYRVIERVGLRRIRPQGGRHTAITQAIMDSDVPAKTVSEMAGHATVGFALTYYAHVLDEHRVEAAKQAPRSSPCNLGDWFSGAPGPGRSRR